MICLLVGHEAKEIHGEGDYAEFSVVICTRCGKEFERRGDISKHPQRGYEAAAAEFYRQRSAP